jgi:hypothetical protein
MGVLQMAFDEVLREVAAYYAQKVESHGLVPAGVDWNSYESQVLRFSQLLKVVNPSIAFSLIDYGAGYGALVDYLAQQPWTFSYTGFDIAEPMVTRAHERYTHRNDCRFVNSEAELEVADYAVASGILNVKLQTPVDAWEQYVLHTLGRLHGLSRKGFAFNALTSYSDPDRLRPDLYYADPCFLFDHCKKRFAKQVAILHDYGLYEFTILVRKELL